MRYQKVAERREIFAGDRRSQDPAASGGQASGTRLRKSPDFSERAQNALSERTGKSWRWPNDA
jgi:hypothetical protein